MSDFVGREIVETAKTVAQIGAEFLKNLVGKSIEEAKKIVADHGLKAREIGPDDRVTMDFVEDRVNLKIKDGVVDDANVG